MNKAGMVLGAVVAAPLLGALPAEAQITYQTLQDPGMTTTGLTGIRGDNITGSYSSDDLLGAIFGSFCIGK